MEKLFKLKENGTNVKTEIIAGISTFMTMAYIISLNPFLLTNNNTNGQELWNAIFMATVLASGIGTICMAFWANKPFVMAPGMGLNNFFAVVVVNVAGMTGMTYLESYQSVICIILIEGIVFIILSLVRVREKIVDAIPIGIRLGIGPAIGLMLMNIGFGSNAGIINENGTFYMLRDFFGAMTPSVSHTAMGDADYKKMLLYVVTTFVGIFVIIALDYRKITGSVLIGMFSVSVLYWIGQLLVLREDPFVSLKKASWLPPFDDMVELTFFKFNFKGLLEIGWLSAIMMIVTFCMIDMFDTIGTLVGTASKAGMLDEDGKMPKMKEALLADAVGTTIGACTGTSTVTTFVESSAGVSVGGRTGLTALVSGILFLLCIFISPLAALIPAPATSAALIYVGVLMLSNLKKVEFDDITQILPIAVMLIAMPITGSIGHSIGLGIIAYTFIMLLIGKAKEVTTLTYVLALLFLVKFFVIV